MRFALGAIIIVAGLYSLIFRERAARSGANFHRRWASVAPWLYPFGLDEIWGSERAMRPVSIAIGLLCIAVGLLVILGIS